MAKFRRIQSSTIVLACLVPFGLSACGSSASSPAAGHSTASKASGSSGTVASTGTTGMTPASAVTASTTTTTTSDTPLGAAGNTTGTIVDSTGTSVAATGTSLTNGALNDPAGITLLNNATPGTGAGNILDANVLSNTAASTAPVQANVLSNGQIVSAGIANPLTGQTPGVTPLVNGVSNTVDTIPGAGQALSTATNETQAAAAGVGRVTDSATAPLNPLLDLQVGKTTLVGSPSTPAAINAELATQAQLANVAVSSPSSAATHGALSSVTGGPLGNLTGSLAGVLNGTPLGGTLPK